MEKIEEEFDFLVVGAGIVGLAISKDLLEKGFSVLTIEKNNKAGEETTSRNSGVIHSGIYYPPDSLKANLCVRGKNLLYEYCKDKKIPFKKVGKLIVATTSNEDHELKKLYKRGLQNNVDIKMLSATEAKNFEPEVKCISAIFSPSTGIVDVPEYTQALEADIQKLGGLVALNSKFIETKNLSGIFSTKIKSGDITFVRSKNIINSAGLMSEEVAKKIHPLRKSSIMEINYAKGHYLKYHGKHPFSKLIYPIPSSGGLGIHITLDIDNQLKFGPDIIYVNEIDYQFEGDLRDIFYKEIKKYWPSVEKSRLIEDYCGIRPKLKNKKNQYQDFFIGFPKNHGINGLYNLQGIESPGLTASLAIAEYITNNL